MTEYTNIDRFNHVTGMILQDAYETFPQTCLVEITTVICSFPHGMREQGEPNVVTHDDMDVVAATAMWLEAEGFIRNLNADTFSLSYVLTLKGFTTLSRTPAALNQTFGERLSESIKEGSWDAVRSTVREILKVGFASSIGC